MRFFLFSFFCLLILVVSCKNDTRDNVSNRAQLKNALSKLGISEISDSTLLILEEWRLDSLGCMRLRNMDKILKVASELDLIGKSREFVVQVFGPPNFVKSVELYIPSIDEQTFTGVGYYFDSICRNAALVDSSDKCWIEFLVSQKTNTVVDISDVCQ